MNAVIHLDADAFFASVEQAADARLRGRPIAVGGEKRGIIASASYEARRYGVYTPMPTARARKLCPRLVVLPGDFEKYERFSQWMFSYAYDFTPEVEITSIDEGYFGLAGVRRPAVEVAEAIRGAIGQTLKLPVSEGIASNKLVSQIASKLHKPHAFLAVPAGREARFLDPLPLRWLPGIGPETAARLRAAGLGQVGQLARTPLELLELLLGRQAPRFRAFAEGIDERPVIPTQSPAKSYSHQETFAADVTDEGYLEATLRRMADRLMAKVRADGKSIRTLTVKVRYNDMDEDQCSESLAEPTDLETDLYGRLSQLLRKAWRRRVSLRMVSLKLSQIYPGIFRPELPFLRSEERAQAQSRLAEVIDELRRTHGAGVILRGHDLRLRHPPRDDTQTPRDRANSPAPSRKRYSIHYRRNPTPTAPATFRESTVEPPSSAASPTVPSPHSAPPIPTENLGGYVPLGVRSYYSFLNSTLSPGAIVALAQRNGYSAVALCDQGNLHGAPEFCQAAVEAGIQPILGAEIRCNKSTVQLYVQNATGYHNLCRILSAQERPADAGSGLPFFGPVPSSALEDTAGLLAVASDPALAERFPGRFYLAVSTRRALRKQRADGPLPAVAWLPVHYAAPEDRWKFDIVQSIRTRTLRSRSHPDKLGGGNYHFRSPTEIAELFRDFPPLLRAVGELAAPCRFDFPWGAPQFPAFQTPDGSSSREFLRRLVFAGMQRRYPRKVPPKSSAATRPSTGPATRPTTGQIRSQVEAELQIIHDVGYEDYFLVIRDLLETCRERGIEWITRGSAADSLVCFCLGISDVCPIRFDLYFRRFLNPERMAMNKLPDVDLDFPHDRKDEVIDLVFEKYGAGHAAVVGGFSTFRARSALGDVAKVLGVSEHQIRRITERIPFSRAGTLEKTLGSTLECHDLPLAEEPYRSAIQMAEFLDGFPRYPKMHPCGVVIARQPIHELTPTFPSQKGYPTTHFDMDAVEDIGLVKIDILAQGGLSVMRDVKNQLRAGGVEINLERCEVKRGGAGAAATPGREATAGAPPASPAALLSAGKVPSLARVKPVADPWTDPAVWEMIASGGARAVHHIESPAMIGLCKMCNVRDIDGLIAIVSVIRPGAANEQKKRRFTLRYQGLEAPSYPHPVLESCLRSTYGLVVYEEHILQICTAFAGLDGGRADVLRRALNKQKLNLIAEIREEFYAAARRRGHPEAKIHEVWELISGFAGYAFCKAHSTAYGVEAYQSAWLKRYFPAEFMAAVLTNGKGFYHPVVYVLECHRLDIPLVPPWVNAPGPEFRTERMPPEALPNCRSGAARTCIRVPVTRIKGLTHHTVEQIIAERRHGEFVSLQDFFRRVAPHPEEMESLIRVGAFDGFGHSRTRQFWEFQILHHRYRDSRDPRQGWLFPRFGTPAAPAPDRPPHPGDLPPANLLTEPTPRERLEWEYELLGFPASDHPLRLHDQIAWHTYCPVARLDRHIGETVVTCGLVIEQRIHQQTTGELMKFLTLADWTGMVETELFAPTYKSYGLATVRYPVLEITATVEPYDNRRGFSLRVHRAEKPRGLP